MLAQNKPWKRLDGQLNLHRPCHAASVSHSNRRLRRRQHHDPLRMTKTRREKKGKLTDGGSVKRERREQEMVQVRGRDTSEDGDLEILRANRGALQLR